MNQPFRPQPPQPPRRDDPDELIAVLNREYRRYRRMMVINGILLAMGLGYDTARLIRMAGRLWWGWQ